MRLAPHIGTFFTGVLLMASYLSPTRAETLTIGYIGSLTGAAAQYGLAGQEGLKIFADKVNAKGGLDIGAKHYVLNVVPYDDQQKPAQAVAAYERLTTVDGANYVFVQNSPSTMAIKAKVESDKTLMLTAAFSPKAIDADTKYTIRLYMNGDNFVPIFVHWLKGHLKERRVATLNQNDETGWGYSQTTEKYFKENGFDVVTNQLYERSLSDFSPILTKILAEKPDLIDVGATTPGTAGLIVRQAHELGYKGRFIQTGGPGWATILAAAGKEATEGMITMIYGDPNNASYAEIAAAYQKTVGQVPNELLVSWYDAAGVLSKAMQIAGDVKDTTKVNAAFSKALPMKSLQGETLTWGHQQILTVNYIAEIKDGKPEIIGKIPD
jgi:branched-chain amino acid transport system substrate-binding protein